MTNAGTEVRIVRPTDQNHLHTLDLKCFIYPQPAQYWAQKVKDMGQSFSADNSKTTVALAVYGNEPVGIICAVMKQGVVDIERLGVLPKFRRKGVARKLLGTILGSAKKMGGETAVITVPDFMCSPGDPDDCSVALKALGFRTTGKITYDAFHMYGQARDGYQFIKDLTNE